MKAEEMPVSTIVALIIVIIVISVAVVFSFSVVSTSKNQTGELSNISNTAVENSSNAIEVSLFSLNCDSRCSAAKAIARKMSANEVCSDKVADSNFCEDTIIYNGKMDSCDQYYIDDKHDACVLTFSSGRTSTLTCVNAVETC